MQRALNRDSLDDRIFYFVNYILLGGILLVTLYPIVFVASASFSSPNAVSTGRVVLWPVEFSLEGYKAVFKNQSVLTGYYNSFVYTIFGTLINVSLTVLAAFPLSRKELLGYKQLNFLFAFTMWFSGGLIPTYLLVRQLGLTNTRWALWLPGAIGVWNVMITRTFFQNSIPEELYESASIDGCGYTRFLWSIAVPLSGAVVAVISLFYAVAHWNTYFNAFIYLSKEELFPLQLVLRDILLSNKIDASMVMDADAQAASADLSDLLKYSLIMVACVPVWCIYPFVQRFFVRGVMLGALKG